MMWEHTVRKVNIILAKIKNDEPFQYASWHWNFHLFLYYSYTSWLAAWNIDLLWGKVKKKKKVYIPAAISCQYNIKEILFAG